MTEPKPATPLEAWMRGYRKKKGVTLVAMAKAIGFSSSALAAIEQGRVAFSPDDYAGSFLQVYQGGWKAKVDGVTFHEALDATRALQKPKEPQP